MEDAESSVLHFFCVPGMGNNSAVRVRYTLGSEEC